MAQIVKNLHAVQEIQDQSLGQEDPLEKKMATHSSSLAWKIPWGHKELERTEHTWTDQRTYNKAVSRMEKVHYL